MAASPKNNTKKQKARPQRSPFASLSLPFTIGIAIAAFLLFAQATSAVVIGVNTGTLTYTNVLRGGYAEAEAVISTDSPTPVPIVLEPYGDIKDWIRYEIDEEPTTSSNKPLKVRIIVEPPLDTPNGEYTGNVRILTGELFTVTNRQGTMGSQVKAALSIRIKVTVTGTQITACQAAGFKILTAEEDSPLNILFQITNKGNVRIQPKLSITALDQFREKTLGTYTLNTPEELLPTTTRRFQETIPHSLPPGQYWAEIDVPLCGDSGIVTFDVVERGGVADQGVLERIDAQSWANTGDIIPITAVFRNVGERVVTAKFKGAILNEDGDIVKVIDTDLYSVPPGQVATIETFFNPQVGGQYIVRGHVLYNNKLSYEREFILNVNGAPLATGNATVASAVASPLAQTFIVAIALLLVLIAVRKKKRKARSRIF